MEKLVLIDGNSLINRAFYAMPLLTTKEGIYTNAVYGFMNMFFKMINDVKPSYVAVAFDVHAPTFRHEMYTDYKGTRKPMPEELRPQIPLLKDVLKLMGVAVIEKAGIEADDIIGTIAKSTSVETVIITGDKDSFQLVDKTTSVYFTKRGLSDTDVLNNDNFKEKTGIMPKQIIDLKSLMGDSSDNIPGVPGVGEKTALSLIGQYGSLDGVYENLGEIKGKLYDKLKEGKELAYLSYKLATINTGCDIDTRLDNMKFENSFSKKVLSEFIRLEFRSLISKVQPLIKDGEETEKTEEKENAESEEDFNFVVISDLSGFTLPEGKDVAFYIKHDKAFFYCDKTEYIINVKVNLIDDGYELPYIISAIKPVLNGDNTFIVYDKKKLKHFLSDYGVDFSAKCEDVSVMKYLADYSGGEESFEEVVSEYGKNQNNLGKSLYDIFLLLKDKLKQEEMESLYYDIELPLSDVLYRMEKEGFKVDTASLYETGKKYALIISDLEKSIKQQAGEENLNVNSPKQLGEILFEKLKIGKGKKTKNGYSTSAEVLEEYRNSHPIIPLILRYRQIQKLQSTYIEGFKPLIDGKEGLIHTSFNQTVTSTGRLSSKEPNLQNIPVREDEGRELRKFFISKFEGGLLVGADYSQIELRLLASFSGCKTLIEAFNRGEDIHSDTASKVFGVDKKDVTPQMRRDAKAVNFGIIYGISEYGLAKNINVTPKIAKEYINSYFIKYPEVKEYLSNCIDFAKKTGYAKTYFGRRRYIKELSSSNFAIRSFGERVAMNMPLQGSAADIIKIAMIAVDGRIAKEGLKSRIILQVHDELIIDTYPTEKEKVVSILREEMENAVNLPVKLTVDVGCGKTWFEAK